MIQAGEVVSSACAHLPEKTLARVASILFTLFVVSVPISIAASQSFLALACAVFVLHLWRDRPRLAFPPIKLPLALFCLFTILSIFSSADPQAGWIAARKLALFLIWALAANLIVTARHLKGIYQALALISALAGLVAAGQFLAQYRAIRAQHLGQINFTMFPERVHGFMGHWMSFGGQQMIIFLCLLSVMLFGAAHPPGAIAARKAESAASGAAAEDRSDPALPRWRERMLGWAALAVIAISIVLNFTRGVWLGCLAGAVYLIARRNPKWLWPLPLALLAGYLATPQLFRPRVQILSHPSSDTTVSIRFEMWRVGLRMIQKHPFLGVGPNNIREVYTLYLPPGQAPAFGYHDHLHNNFIQIAAERGLPCLAAWLWLMAALGWRFRRLRRERTARGESTWVSDAATAAWLALLVGGCFEYNFGSSPVLMLFLFVSSSPFTKAEAAST